MEAVVLLGLKAGASAAVAAAGLLLIFAAMNTPLSDEVRRFVYTWLKNHFVPAVVGGLLVNLVIAPGPKEDLSVYRYYPLSLAGVSLYYQISRLVGFRIIAAGIVGVALLAMLSGTEWILALVLIMAMVDSITIIIRETYDRSPKQFYTIIFVGISLVICDLFILDNKVSIYMFGGHNYYHLLMFAVIPAFVSANKRIRREIRYES